MPTDKYSGSRRWILHSAELGKGLPAHSPDVSKDMLGEGVARGSVHDHGDGDDGVDDEDARLRIHMRTVATVTHDNQNDVGDGGVYDGDDGHYDEDVGDGNGAGGDGIHLIDYIIRQC